MLTKVKRVFEEEKKLKKKNRESLLSADANGRFCEHFSEPLPRPGTPMLTHTGVCSPNGLVFYQNP